MEFGYVMVFVTDVQQAKQFYQDILELPLIHEEPNRLVFSMGPQKLVLFQADKKTETGDYSNEARTVLVFHVGDVHNTFAKLQEKGVQFLHTKPTEARYAAFTDPFGNVHEIAEKSNE
ncbi:VOC family protein [Paenisporosarcina cavernae]|uniref:VOC family protein n=1 Tax=Paenisporosarcina cavernae TaxID=2320858 RepID=A0A385YX01_9BACL|nr:VOC family protein [Paenisporosarcina cavernae]AYC30073.1 VOC family protein [Paenisporosarcina cavernae]